MRYDNSMFTGINHVTVVVRDKKIAENFYCGVLGLEKVVVGKSLWAKAGGQFIHINENQMFYPPKSFTHFALAVNDLHPYLEELISRGIRIFDFTQSLEEVDVNDALDKEQKNFFTYDPFGNLIEFIDCDNSFFKQ